MNKETIYINEIDNWSKHKNTNKYPYLVLFYDEINYYKSNKNKYKYLFQTKSLKKAIKKSVKYLKNNYEKIDNADIYKQNLNIYIIEEYRNNFIINKYHKVNNNKKVSGKYELYEKETVEGLNVNILASVHKKGDDNQ